MLRINLESLNNQTTYLDWCRAFVSVVLKLRTLKNPGLSLNSSVSNYQNSNLTSCYFHMLIYQVFARKLTWYFIGVYIIITISKRFWAK